MHLENGAAALQQLQEAAHSGPASVAGDLQVHTDSFTTCSGREVDLKIYVEAKDTDKTDFAMGALKRAMKWDEEVYGREYDLDIFMIVAVDDFNMGAMENKGLNIFNSKYVLASPETATSVSVTLIRPSTMIAATNSAMASGEAKIVTTERAQ